MAKCAITHKREKLKFEVTEEVIHEIKALILAGMTQKQICEYYDIGYDLWLNRKYEYPELDKIVRQGKMKTTAIVAGYLLELCRDRNLTAVMFYLKTQGGWKEAKDDVIEPENKPDEKQLITVTDPIEAAKIYQQYILNT